MKWHLLFLQLKMVDLQSSEADLAKSALFTKHPEMKSKFHTSNHAVCGEVIYFLLSK